MFAQHCLSKAYQYPLHLLRPNFPGEFTLQMKCVPCFTHLLHKQRAASLVQLIRATAQERLKPAPEELPHSSKPIWENLLIRSHA